MPVKLIAASHTPFDANGNLNLAPVALQAAHLQESGVAGVFVGGSTGESHSLTVEERLDLAGHWLSVGRKFDLQIIIHVGHNCQRDAMRMAAHASENGADAISALAPCYFKPRAVADLVDFCQPIAAAASKLPFYFYDIPALTGVSHPNVEFLKLASQRIPSFAGVKYTNIDLMQFQECLGFENGRYEIFYGCDENLLAAYALGGRSAVGSSFNFASPLYHRIVEAYELGDTATARGLQLKSIEMIRACESYGYLPAAKSLMSIFGIDCGPVRSPLRNLTPAQKSELRSKIEAMDVLSTQVEALN